MKSIDVKGTARTETGKKAARNLRKSDLIPCNLYGEKRENGLPVAENFTVSAAEVRNLIYTPDIHSVNLTIDGKEHKAIVKELQFHPVTDKLLHIDFYEITDKKPIVIAVPIKLNGLAEGVRAGGKLALNVRKLAVKALYTQFPDTLDIDVTNLALGKSMKVAELSYEGLEIITSKEVVVCAVRMTRAARAAAAEAETEE